MVGAGGIQFNASATRGGGLIDQLENLRAKVDDLTQKLINATDKGEKSIGGFLGIGSADPAEVRKQLTRAQNAMRIAEKQLEQLEQAGQKDASQVAALVGQG
jgi:hypothetical protein